VQLGVCALVLGGASYLMPVSWQTSVVIGLGLALSSTAVALAILKERNLLNTAAGMAGFGILLFQDIAAIPILTLLPLLGSGSGAVSEAGHAAAHPVWLGVLVIVAVIVVGRYLLRPALRLIANTGYRELFTGFALLLVVSVALLMQTVGLSMALGALIAGVLLADSEYRHALETDIEPFKGLLLGLFFIAIGMTIDFGILLQHPWQVLAWVLFAVGLKTASLLAMSRWFGIAKAERTLFAIVLSQGSEFAFVVFALAGTVGVLSVDLVGSLNLVVAISMATTPLLLLVYDRVIAPRLTIHQTLDETIAYQDHPIVIAGFGRYGQIVGRMLLAQGIRPTVLEIDPDQIESLRKFGYKVFYGDATRLDLLHAAGAEQAKVLVVAVDDVEDSLKIVELAKHHFPHLKIIARARNVSHVFRLMDQGVAHIERETFESALRSARGVLEALGVAPSDARRQALAFRRHNIQSLLRIYPHYRDQKTMVSMAKEARAELEDMFRADQIDQTGKSKQGWDGS
jgi:glutathione-regulated potassium-efflux system ancillary protein KefC